MPPEYVHFFPHCLHWRLNPVRHPSGLRISPVMASSPWHEHRGTILDKTPSVAQWRNKCNWRSECFKCNARRIFRRGFSYSYMPCPSYVDYRYSKHPIGYSKTEGVKKKRRIRSWWPSANRPTLFLAKRLEPEEYQSRSFSEQS